MKRNIWKRAVWIKLIATLADILFLLSMAGLILFSYYLDDVLHTAVLPKLHDAVRRATNGHYSLSNEVRIGSSQGMILLYDVRIAMTGYQDSGVAVAVREVVVDTVRLRGINWWDVVIGDGLRVTHMEMHAPKVFMMAVDTAFIAAGGGALPSSALVQLLPNPSVISFDSIVVTGAQVYVSDEHSTNDRPFLDSISVRMSEVLLEEEGLQPLLALSYQSMDVHLPRTSYAFDDSTYRIEARNIRTSINDSLLRIDSFALVPRLSKEEFAAHHRYVRGRSSLRSRGIEARGVDFTGMMEWKRIRLRACEVQAWSVEYYSDKRRPRDPKPPPAKLPNDFFRSFPLAFDIDSVRMRNGKIAILERAPGSLKPGVLTFDQVSIRACCICSDTLSPHCGKPTQISMTALFLGEGEVTVQVTYPVFSKDLDLRIAATVGTFSAKKLNAFLMPNERKEVTSGVIEGGELEMDIRAGTSTTSVTPLYRDLSMKVLADDAKKGRGILEGLKTLIANTFILRSDNRNGDGEKALTGTTKRTRNTHEEFLQFIWLAIRRSLNEVIGGIE